MKAMKRYLKFIIQRDWKISLIWLLAFAGFAVLLAAIYPGLFPNEEAIAGLVSTMNNPSMIAMMGPVYGLEAVTPAILMSQECMLWFAIAVALMNIFFVNRYTRTDEELGRHELLIALPIDRLSNAKAMLLLSFTLNCLVALVISLCSWITQIEGMTLCGALTYGFSIAMQGFVFAMLTLLSAQLFSTARGSMGFAFAILGLSYILRAYGDMTGNVLSWISPLGLGLQVEAFYSNHFLPVLYLFIEGIILAGIAVFINRNRDMGTGIIPARKGKAHASKWLQTPLGFAWRLSKNNFMAWSIALFVVSAMYGSVVEQLDSFVKGNDMIQKMLQSSVAATMTDAFLAMIACITAILTAIPLLNGINRVHNEEKRGRLSQLMALSVSRRKLFSSFIFIAFIEAMVFPLISVLGFYGAGYSAGSLDFGKAMQAFYVYVPSLWFMCGLSVFFVGFLPQLKSLVWAILGYSFLLFYFGRLIPDIPQAIIKGTPFGCISQLPIEPFSVFSVLILLFLATGLTFLGIKAYEKRDII